MYYGNQIAAQLNIPVSIYGHAVLGMLSAEGVNNQVGHLWTEHFRGSVGFGSTVQQSVVAQTFSVTIQAENTEEITQELLMSCRDAVLEWLYDG